MPAKPLQRILYVDDDEEVQRLVQLALERIGGLAVQLVNDSSTAVEAFHSFKPDMIILDRVMPGLDGLALFNIFRSMPEAAEIPIVFLTVEAYWRTIEEFKDLGAAGVITKPFLATELAAQLKQIWASQPDVMGPAT